MSSSATGTTMQRPYLLRAMHEWMSDNSLTPHIVIDVSASQASLPLEYAKDGRLIINVSYSATENLLIDNETASFQARFNGVSRHLEVPIAAIVGIYARETGQGMIFSSESGPENAAEDAPEAAAGTAPEDSAQTDGDDARKPSRPQLKIIK